MKKFIVLICSLVLVFSLVIPASASTDFEPISVAKSFNADMVLVANVDNTYLFKVFNFSNFSDYSTVYIEDKLNEFLVYADVIEETQYIYNDNLMFDYSDTFNGSYYMNITQDYDYPFSEFCILINGVIVEGTIQEEPEQPFTEIQLLERNNEILTHIYTAILFSVSIAVVVLVVFLLYKFLRKFF